MSKDRNESSNERAPLLLVFCDLAPRVASLIRVRPILIARLIVAPPEAVHSIAAYLHLAPDAARPDADVAALVADADPRDLLRAALPLTSPRLYRALDRAGDRARTKDFYHRLGAICRGPFADALLDGGPLDDKRIAYFEALAALDPLLPSVRGALPEDRYSAEAVDALIAFLRSHGALRDGDLRLPRKAKLAAVVRRLTRALGRVRAPAPGFAVPAPFRLVETTDELQRIGRAFGNCVARPQWRASQHHLGLLDGSDIYLVSDAPPMLVGLRRAAPGVVAIDQMAGPKNGAAPDGARDALRRDLAAAGLRVVSTDPATALARLDDAVRRGRDAEDDGDECDALGDGPGDGLERDAAA